MKRRTSTFGFCVGIAALLWAGVFLLPEKAFTATDMVSGKSETAGPQARQPSRWVTRFGKSLDRQLECLALNIYWEARSETPVGRLAVASVTLNRVSNPMFPDTVCGVVSQGEQYGRHKCQFSWVCDGAADTPRNKEAFRAARDVAYTALYLDPPDPTHGALWYHADYVRPKWARAKHRLVHIGKHIYYGEQRQAENTSPAPRS